MRDALQLRAAVNQCSDLDLREVHKRIDNHQDAALLRAPFRQVPAPAEDARKRAALTLADYHTGTINPLPRAPAKFRAMHRQWISALLGEKSDRHRTWATAWERSHDAATSPVFSGFERLVPRLAWPVRISLRLAMRCMAFVSALPAATAIRRTIAQLERTS